MRVVSLIVAGVMLGCVAPHTQVPSSATEGESGLLSVVLILDKLK